MIWRGLRISPCPEHHLPPIPNHQQQHHKNLHLPHLLEKSDEKEGDQPEVEAEKWDQQIIFREDGQSIPSIWLLLPEKTEILFLFVWKYRLDNIK